MSEAKSNEYRNFSNPFFKGLGIVVFICIAIVFFGLIGVGLIGSVAGLVAAALLALLGIIGLPILLFLFVISWLKPKGEPSKTKIPAIDGFLPLLVFVILVIIAFFIIKPFVG